METSSDSSKKTTEFKEAFGAVKSSVFYEEPNEKLMGKGSKSETSKIGGGSILVNSCQRGNPLLKHITDVPWEFSEIVPDYVLGPTSCALYLSLRYFNLFPDYIHDRLKALGQQYGLRVLLVEVDVKDPHHSLNQLTRICILAKLTLILSWSSEESGKIIEGYKIFENKPPDMIKERQESDGFAQVLDALGSIRSVNKTDAITLVSSFETLSNIIMASQDELALCPGIGPAKASQIYKLLHSAFKRQPRE